MSLVNPVALAWLALAVPIVVFYILKIRMRRVPVSTVMFWEQIFEEKQPRSIREQLRHLLSLLLQLVFLGLLVFALADPLFSSQVRNQQRIVLVVDNSASMQSLDGTRSRLEQAKLQAGHMIKSLRPRDELALVSAGNQAKVVCGLTGHQRTLRAAIDRIAPTDGPTHVDDAVKLGRQLLADHEKARIIVLSDGCFPQSPDMAADESVSLIPIGDSTDNVGITRFQVRRSLLDPTGYQVLAEVRNFGDEAIDCRLDMELGDQLIDVIPVQLEPRGEYSQVFEKTSVTGGILRASIDVDDRFSVDNEAIAILPIRKRIPVTLITEGNLFLENVFRANPLVDLTVAHDLPKEHSSSVLVLHKTVPDVLPPGNVIVIHPQTSTDHWEIGEDIENPIVVTQEKDSDLMVHVQLQNVLMPEARAIRPTSEVNVLVEAGDENPLYFSIDRPGGRAVVLSVNLDQGDLPLRTAFPIMVSNALTWFDRSGGELHEAESTGMVVDIELPESLVIAESGESFGLFLESPDETLKPIAVGGESIAIGPLDRCGVWTIQKRRLTRQGDSWPGPVISSLSVACNLTNSVESDLHRPEFGTATESTQRAGFGGRPIWFYLVLIAWLLTGLEWFLYQRRIVG